jgi:hypothetical protein
MSGQPYAPVVDINDLGDVQPPKGITTAFCIGNGESRKGFDLNTLKPHGKIYGCNALYREFTPDVLVAVDPGISHEIYQSGYCNKNVAYFREWIKYEASLYDNIINVGLNKNDIENLKDNYIINERTAETSNFVMHGSNLKQILENKKNNNQRANVKINFKELYISWIKDNDYSFSIDDLPIKDKGWSTGASSGLVACNQNHFTIKELYLIGHDLFSYDDNVNNLYKDTPNYVRSNEGETPCVNWISQWAGLIYGYPRVQFYKVNRTKEDNKVDRPIKEWNVYNNLKYITYEELKEKFKL